MWGRLVTVIAVGAALAGEVAAAPALDYGFFKSKVEPIFLQKRPGHTRCYFCHVESNNALHLEKLAAGQNAWIDEQSRKNVATISKLVNPGEPDTSGLLLHPRAPEGGGDAFHSGGRQFADRNDPEWKAIAAWINGAK